MVKLFCNRCGKECEATYHIVKIHTCNIHPYPSDAACCASYSHPYSPIEELNREKHYCVDCVREVKTFLGNKEETV